MDGEYQFDIGEIGDSIDNADVVGLYFPLLRKTLLLDFRTNDVDGPYMQVVPMANSVEERFRSLKKMRPRFPRPESITLIPWPKYVRSLKALGVLDRLNARFAREGFRDLIDRLPGCVEELTAAERTEITNAITGTEYQSIWESGRR
jgi:hypothetical protein